MSDCFDHELDAWESYESGRFHDEPNFGDYEYHASKGRKPRFVRGQASAESKLEFFNRINPFDEFDIEEDIEETNENKGKQTMNISYMQTVYDESIKTVGVSFNPDDIMAKVYIYKTRLDLKVGDLCIVNPCRKLTGVIVVEVHDEPAIDPHDTRDYKWITQKVDVQAMEDAEQEDKDAALKVRRHIRNKAREKAKAELAETFGDDFQLLGELK